MSHMLYRRMYCVSKGLAGRDVKFFCVVFTVARGVRRLKSTQYPHLYGSVLRIVRWVTAKAPARN